MRIYFATRKRRMAKCTIHGPPGVQHRPCERGGYNDRTISGHFLDALNLFFLFFFFPFYPPHSRLTKAGRTPHRCRGKKNRKRETWFIRYPVRPLVIPPLTNGERRIDTRKKKEKKRVGRFLFSSDTCTPAEFLFLSFIQPQTCVVSTWDRPRPPIFNWPLKVGRDHQLSAFSLSRFPPGFRLKLLSSFSPRRCD